MQGSDILFLCLAILLIAGLGSLCAFLSIVFVGMRAHRLPEGTPLPAGAADLYETAISELAKLGFSPPQWVTIAPERETPGVLTLPAAVFCHPQKETVAVVMPPANICAPNALTIQYVTRLADGRALTSSVRDLFPKWVSDDRSPAQTIDGDTFAEQFRQHRRWRKKFAVPALPGFAAPEALDDFLRRLGSDALLARLLAAKKLWIDKKPAGIADAAGQMLSAAEMANRMNALAPAAATDAARPTLRFALRLLRLCTWRRLRSPVWPKGGSATVPVPRLLMFAGFLDCWRERTLPARWQWPLFTIAAASFALLGTPFYGMSFALSILAAIALHEGGQYLALRAFGYRQVQVPALPLFGGVKTGGEQKASAAQRGWVAMMGPLPGILLGWALLFMLKQKGGALDMSNTVFALTALLLAVNYLNLLPILALDGSRIVQALLPPRRLTMRAVLIVVAVLACVALAAYFGLYVLAVLALLLSLAAAPVLTCGWAVRALADDPAAMLAFAVASPEARRQQVLECFERLVGPKTDAQQRLTQMETVVEALTQPPLQAPASWRQRLALAVVYGGLLLLPLAALGVAAVTEKTPVETAVETSDGNAAEVTRYAQTMRSLLAQAKALSRERLLADLPGGRQASPASEAALNEAEARLGVALPAELRDWYQIADGIPALDIAPVERIGWVAERADWREAMHGVAALEISGSSVRLPAEAPGWLFLGGENAGGAAVENAMFLLYRAAGKSDAAGPRWLRCYRFGPVRECNNLIDLDILVRNMWISTQMRRQERKQETSIVRQIFLEIAAVPMPALLARLKNGHGEALPPADPAAIAAAQERLGAELPADYRAFLELRNGEPRLDLWPVEELRRMPEKDGAKAEEMYTFDQFAFAALRGVSAEPLPGQRRWRRAGLDTCIALGGSDAGEYDDAILWCPDAAFAQARIVSLQERVWAPDFSTYLRYRVAREIASEEQWQEMNKPAIVPDGDAATKTGTGTQSAQPD